MLSLRMTAAVCFAAAAATAQDLPMIARVDVETELAGAEANALDFWPEIDRHLTDAILAAADPMLSERGYIVDVRIVEISMDGLETLPGNGTFNRLEGWVHVRDVADAAPIESERIVLDAQSSVTAENPRFHIIPGRPDFYIVLVNAFAARVVEAVVEFGA